MNKRVVVFVLLALFIITLQAQNAEDRQYIISKTNVKALKKLEEKFNNDQQVRFKRGIPQVDTNKAGRISYLSGFNSKGAPVYDYDDNLNAAITVRTNKIWTGGTSGLNLTGIGINIGLWEASGVGLESHQEYTGRLVQAEAVSVTNHATHVAGTLIATGINSEAQGMASAATIVSRKSNSDESELASFGANGGLISNHSYSTGNPDGDIPGYGAYTENSAEWDEIAFYAPYLLMCKSAGNNRNDPTPNPADNGYDILYTVALSKNVLTVGAVKDVANYTGPSSVRQSDFSNWGPTDDWRIKPDITANGVDVFSSTGTGNSDYEYKSGTSMSCPTVTGTIALLQELYKKNNSTYMKASTAKALVISTADEVGLSDGPDFQSGWGLLNAERAAKVITSEGNHSLIRESTINNNGSFTISLTTEATPLTVCIVWTDPAGSPKTNEDNKTPVLVNDLDVRVTKDGTTHYPWVMTPNSSSDNFTDKPTKGDNFRDNVEKIEFIAEPGTYSISVTHKGSLKNGSQDFSLVAFSSDSVGIITGINQSYNESELKSKTINLYPNPTTKNITIEIPENINEGEYFIEILNLNGHVLQEIKAYEKQKELDVSGLKEGIYFIKVKTNTQIYSGRFIITK